MAVVVAEVAAATAAVAGDIDRQASASAADAEGPAREVPRPGEASRRPNPGTANATFGTRRYQAGSAARRPSFAAIRDGYGTREVENAPKPTGSINRGMAPAIPEDVPPRPGIRSEPEGPLAAFAGADPGFGLRCLFDTPSPISAGAKRLTFWSACTGLCETRRSWP
jgi:hypothetical protein